MKRHLSHLQHLGMKKCAATVSNPLFFPFIGFSFLPVIFLVFFLFILFSTPVSAHDPFDDIEIKVWSSQSFDDPFCSDDPVEIYFRVNRASYITIYQINPWGGVDIIYPRPHHRWLPVQPGRTHRLVDVASDLALYYNGAEGQAYIGVIATRHPIDIVPWLEAGFRDRGVVCGRPSRVAVNIDFNLVINRVLADVRVRLGSACAPAYYVTPIYVRPHVIVHRRPVVIYPPPRGRDYEPWHKSKSPKWGYDRDYDHDRDHHSQPEPEKSRPFRRRGFEAPAPEASPNYRRPYETVRAKPETSSASEQHSVQKTDEVKVKNDSSDGGRGEPSKGSNRRVKKN